MLRNLFFAAVFCVVLSSSSYALNVNWDWCEPFFFAIGLSVTLVWDRRPRQFKVKMNNGEIKTLRYTVSQLTQERDEKSVCVSNGIFVQYPDEESRKAGIRWCQQAKKTRRDSDELVAIRQLTALVKTQAEAIEGLKAEVAVLTEQLS